MHKIILFFSLVLYINSSFAQANSIEANYTMRDRDNREKSNTLFGNVVNIKFPQNTDLHITVKGLANLKADTFVAIFSATQFEKTAPTVNEAMNKRLQKVQRKLETFTDISVYVDMVTFVPKYEYEVEKKVFSKNYNEVPTGFVLKKNIHVKYTKPAILDTLINAFAVAEIYDLVKVEYYSSKLELKKQELQKKAHLVLKEKLKSYQELLTQNLDSAIKHLADGFNIYYPAEMYQSYEAFESQDVYASKFSKVTNTQKDKTFFYNPLPNKDFDFTIDPVIFEPVIQVTYEIQMKLDYFKPQTKSAKKDIYYINNSGQLIKIPN